jgi:hypothetical protein
VQHLVLYDSSNENLVSLGDFVRFIEIIKHEDFLIATSKKNNFFYYFNEKPTLNINNINYNNYKVINLISGKKIKNAFFDINNYFKNASITKETTFKLVENFKSIINYKPKETEKEIKLDQNSLVGFNWIVPNEWAIKSYPLEKWKYIQEQILKKYKIKISWQKKDNLESYIKWIKGCNILISIVGLGVHLANYFDKKVIMLTGPTDFFESNLQKNILKVLPENYCEHRPCNLPTGVNNCGCMPNINPSQVLNKFEKIVKFN